MSNMYRTLLFVAVLLSLTGCQQIMDRLIGTTDAVSPSPTVAADQSNSGGSIATATVSTQMPLPAQPEAANVGESLTTAVATEEIKVVSVKPEGARRDLDQSVRKNARSDQQKNEPENKQQAAPTTSVETLKKPVIDNVRVYIED
jgi:hypothetical protein